jgi:beta-glucosidase
MKICLIFVLSLLLSTFNQADDTVPVYRDPGADPNERVADLLARMTLEEKVGQLQCLVFQDVLNEDLIGEHGIGGIAYVRIKLPYTLQEEVEARNRVQKIAVENTRLGIPILFHCEALHGLVDKGATSFPQAIGLASTWNPALMEEVARSIATEVKARGFRQVLSPTVDIARDVRWGRVAETYGEDPYLASQMAVAFCKSFEEQNVITTLKHFVANSGTGGRDSHPVHYSERMLREVYFPPYRQAIEQAGVRSVMASYTAVDGLPSGANRWLLTDILRDEWGFEGTVVSDYALLGRRYKSHLVATGGKDAAVKALKAGLDRDLPRIGENNTFDQLVDACQEGLITEEDLNTAVRRVLKQKFELGLFENPYTDVTLADQVTNTPESKALAREAARQSLVLLKNVDHSLPLRQPKKVVVIGEDAVLEKLGDYSPWDIEVVTLLEGIENEAPAGTVVEYLPLGDLGEDGYPAVSGKFIHPTGTESPGFRAEYFANPHLSGKPFRTQNVASLNFNWGSKGPSVEAGNTGQPFSARFSGTLVSLWEKTVPFSLNIVGGARVRINDELLFNNWDDPYATTHQFTYAFQKGKNYEIVIEYNSSGQYAKCILGWDIVPAQDNYLTKLTQSVKQAGVAVIVAGVTEKEGQDRASLDIPENIEKAIVAAGATGTKTVVVLTAGSAITMDDWYGSADAILSAWYPGQEGGTAVAEALFGEYNPGGKLTITFPYSVAQCPLYYNHKPSGRGYGYVNMTGEPRYAFGYGLSYTTFAYADLKLSKMAIDTTEETKVSLVVENTGPVAGDEVVQLYLHDKVASVVRPVKELKKFQRIALQPGETKTVEFTITPKDLSMYDYDLNWGVEPGEFEVMIGSSSQDIRLKEILTVAGKDK